MRAAILLPVLALLAGCSLPGAERPADPMLPAAFAASPRVPVREALGERWWTAFADPALDRLVADALAANNDLAAGVQRVAQARAQLRVAGSTLLPQADGSGSLSRDYTERSSGSSRSGSSASTSGSAGLSISYEVDLFGANRAAEVGAQASYESQRFAFRALALAVQADTAAGYLDLLAAREQLAVARDNLAAQERVLQLVETRYQQGAVSGFDLTRQRSAVASARARIPALEETVARLGNALAILLGRPPEGFAVAPRDLFALALPGYAVGLPADLLLRRPDLLAADADLRAADADISAARAAFYPRLDLTAALSGIDLTGSPGIAASIASGLTAPLFSAGRLEGSLQGAEARHAELVAVYRQRILTALSEVESALLAAGSADRQEELYRLAADQAAQALQAAETRYATGAEDLLSVLDAQRVLLDANANLVSARQARLTASVDLVRALGGGWTPGV